MKPSYIFSEGFRQDLSKFIEMYQKSIKIEHGLNFEHFKECWRRMNFDGIFVGKSSTAEFYECCEEYLHIAKEYFLSADSLKIFGIYLLYTLYYKQPAAGYAKVRLTPKQWIQLKIFWETLDLKNHARLMISKMYKDGALMFVLVDKEYALDVCYEKFHNIENSR